MTTRGIGTTCGEENLDRIESAVSDLGFRLRTSDKTVDARTMNMRKPLAEYVWAIADYRAETMKKSGQFDNAS